MTDVDARLARAIEHLRFAFDELAACAPHAPAAVDRVLTVTVAHLRSWRPESVTPLGVLGPPTEPIRDPRTTP